MLSKIGIKGFEFRFSGVCTDEDIEDSPPQIPILKIIDLISDKFPECLRLIVEITETISFEGRNNNGVIVVSSSLLLMGVIKVQHVQIYQLQKSVPRHHPSTETYL